MKQLMAFRQLEKRSLKTAMSWKTNSAWMPGGTVRASSTAS
jgi:hypothetical protein